MNINDNSKYDGYFCKKCKSIPIIQIILKNSITKILSACKCHKHYENIESFKKNKSLKEKIEISKISNEPIYLNYHKDINININSIKSKYDKAKKEFFQKSNELKNKIIKLYEEKINHVEKMLDKYIKRNNIIIEVIDKIIKSYEMMKDNPSNVQNLLNNCVFDNRFKINSLLEVFKTSLDDISKKLENYFEEELIVSNSIVNRSIKKEKLTNNNYCEISNFIEINKNICAWCSKYKSYITVMNPNKRDSYNLNFIADLKYVNCMIKSSSNNLISIGNDGFIKIWPLIDDEFIDKEIKKEDNDKIKIIDVNLKPLLEFKDETKEIKKIERMVNFKGDKFIANAPRRIFLFKYIINSTKAELQLINYYEYALTQIKKVEYKFLNDIVDIIPIEKDNKEILALSMKNYIHFLNIPNFELINTINVKNISKNCLLQINSNEILIVDNINYLKIIDINTSQTKLAIKSSSSINILLKSPDDTIIYSGFDGIKRCLIKTMENLPDLIQLTEDNEYYYYDDYYKDNIVCLAQLKNGTIIACYQNGMIQSFKLDI
jgi:hypothetical protein